MSRRPLGSAFIPPEPAAPGSDQPGLVRETSILFTRTREYLWCNPPSIALAWTERKSPSRCRSFNEGIVRFAEGSMMPAPKEECGRPTVVVSPTISKSGCALTASTSLVGWSHRQSHLLLIFVPDFSVTGLRSIHHQRVGSSRAFFLAGDGA
jgi:hypothetical protein